MTASLRNPSTSWKYMFHKFFVADFFLFFLVNHSFTHSFLLFGFSFSSYIRVFFVKGKQRADVKHTAAADITRLMAKSRVSFVCIKRLIVLQHISYLFFLSPDCE